jgi:hypothetical protein
MPHLSACFGHVPEGGLRDGRRFASGVNASADYEMYLRIDRHFPLCRYDDAVAECRFYGEKMIRNSGLC